MDSECEVGDELGSGNEKQEEYHTGNTVLVCEIGNLWVGSRDVYLMMQFNIQTSPSIHPTVVSPLKESHPKTKSSENGVP